MSYFIYLAGREQFPIVVQPAAIRPTEADWLPFSFSCKWRNCSLSISQVANNEKCNCPTFLLEIEYNSTSISFFTTLTYPSGVSPPCLRNLHQCATDWVYFGETSSSDSPLTRPNPLSFLKTTTKCFYFLQQKETPYEFDSWQQFTEEEESSNLFAEQQLSVARAWNVKYTEIGDLKHNFNGFEMWSRDLFSFVSPERSGDRADILLRVTNTQTNNYLVRSLGSHFWTRRTKVLQPKRPSPLKFDLGTREIVSSRCCRWQCKFSHWNIGALNG